uniref:Uncharacterized protein n=1 Tax=Mycobacterium riyadhense TaxID=486698 RepID=A0A653EY02_9MYCO|nr:hypothetical protein BIN_B_04211 [Mycobacterium riyadhense]
MIVDWPAEFGDWLDRLESDAETDAIASRRLDYITAQLQVLNELTGIPEEESATLKRVRQSKRHPVWRLSHPYDPQVAVRLIVWFPDDEHAVIALRAGDKAQMGDVFYDSVGVRADAAIDQWKREVQR